MRYSIKWEVLQAEAILAFVMFLHSFNLFIMQLFLKNNHLKAEILIKLNLGQSLSSNSGLLSGQLSVFL